MNLTAERLRELLVKPGHVSKADFESAVEDAKRTQKELEEVIVSSDLIKDSDFGQLLAAEYDTEFINLKKVKINPADLNLIPHLVAEKKKAIVFSRTADEVKIALNDPEDLETIHAIEKRVGLTPKVYYATKNDIQSALTKYKSDIKEEFDRILEELKDENLSREDRDVVVVKIVDTLIQYGYDNKCSDIHVEPYEKKIMIRFRIDGIMHDVLDVPKEFSEFIVSRIKILSKMRTDEHHAAQDGKMRFNAGIETIDIRVSIVPVTQGENVVMRLLSAKARQFNLADLGLIGEDFKAVKRAIDQPHGMILVTGPTGSGKTTTLYAVMKILNKRDVHISTIEDPVEYDIEGISQIQVNPGTNLTFAKGLRAIVRQDPDIIMVGEIRDEETAGIAVNSALTGHLVLSTLHTNDSVTTLPRLLDMKVEPFLVASTINVVIAQRLIRKICENCRASYKITDDEKKMIEFEPALKSYLQKKGYYKNLSKMTLYHGAGCPVCGNSGFTGRIGIFEVLEMTENIRDLIMKRANSDELMVQAKKNGMTTMMEDGIEKVLTGITTLDEVMKAAKG